MAPPVEYVNTPPLYCRMVADAMQQCEEVAPPGEYVNTPLYCRMVADAMQQGEEVAPPGEYVNTPLYCTVGWWQTR